MGENNPVYSIQRTYIIKPVSKSEKRVLTCDQRIDIPTIEPLTSVEPLLYVGQPITVIPCIELAGDFLAEFNLTFETNEGVTVLPIIVNSEDNPLENPYTHSRYALVFPRGATGVKSCKVIHKATGKEVQHNFTFGIMPPPYNYDSVLFGHNIYLTAVLEANLTDMWSKVNSLRVETTPLSFAPAKLPKGVGKQTISIKDGVLFYETEFSYPSSTEVTTHKPKITLRGNGRDFVYTLSLNKTTNAVMIDLLTGTITAYDSATGEIIQQFKLAVPKIGFNSLSFENFDDIDTSVLEVTVRGRRLIS